MEYVTINELKPFEDIKKSRTNYERAKRDIGDLMEFLKAYKEKLDSATGLTPDFNEPRIIPATVKSGDVKFDLQCEKRLSKTPYQKIVEGWEGYLVGIQRVELYRTIAGVIKENGNSMSTEWLRDSFEFTLQGIIDPDIKYNILKTTGEVRLSEITLPQTIVLDTESANVYLNGLRLAKDMGTLIGAYENAIHSKAKKTKKKAVEVTQRVSYLPETGKREGPNWKHVVDTLMTMPLIKGDDSSKEIEELGNKNLGLEERINMYGDRYVLSPEKPYGIPTLYVSIPSVINRIKTLKGEKKIKADVKKVKHQEVV